MSLRSSISATQCLKSKLNHQREVVRDELAVSILFCNGLILRTCAESGIIDMVEDL